MTCCPDTFANGGYPDPDPGGSYGSQNGESGSENLSSSGFLCLRCFLTWVIVGLALIFIMREQKRKK